MMPTDGTDADGSVHKTPIYIYWMACPECGWETAAHGRVACPECHAQLELDDLAGAIVDDREVKPCG